MELVGKPEDYAGFHGSFAEPNPFANPDDFLSFIEEKKGALAQQALDGYRQFGRGMVLLWMPGNGPFVRAQYALADERDRRMLDEGAGRDLGEYDAETCFVVGFPDEAHSWLRFWLRVRVAD